MKGRNTFDESQVREILGLRKRMTPKQIARLFDAPTQVVANILTGKSYRHITHIDTGPCHCPSCSTAELGDDNLAHIRALPVTIPCQYCDRPATTSVAHGLASHGLVGCARCDGRRG